MKVKQTALCFVFLLSSQYLLLVAAQAGSSKNKVPLKRGSNSFGCPSNGCMLKPALVKKLDNAFETIRDNLPDSFPLKNATVDSGLTANGTISGFKDFRVVGPYTCECGKDFVRIIVNVSFLQILLDCVLSVMKDVMGHLLGPIGVLLVDILGDVTEFVLKLLGINIEIQIAVVQKFIPGTNLYVENFSVADVSDIEILGIGLLWITDIASLVLTPILNVVLDIILQGPVRAEFEKVLNQQVIDRDEIICS